MIVNIKSQLNITALNFAINNFVKNNNGKQPNYLIMNKETRDNLIITEYDFTNVTKTHGHKYIVYCGFPLAICEKLDFGEVEII